MTEKAKSPAGLRANARPTDGYVLSVDGKWKQRYDSAPEAMAAGEKLKAKFPVIQISVYDAAEGTYSAVPPAAAPAV
jgi:hypothetical protein